MNSPHQRGRALPRIPLLLFPILASLFGIHDTATATESRKLLFFDLWKLDYWDNAALCQGEPAWLPEASYIDPSAPKGGIYFPSVWRDEASGKWRMVYSLKWSPFTLMAAESDKGIRWRPLAVPDAAPADRKQAPHHLFTVPGGEGSGVYLDPNKTDGYGFRIFGRQQGDAVLERARTDPEHPWHEAALAGGGKGKPYISEAITLVSKDGLHWELKTGGHWNWDQPGWHPEPPVFAFWNGPANRHVMTVRPGWGDRRQCLRFSRDLRQWSDPELQFQPDPLDTAGPIGMYGLPVIPVGNGAGFVGLLWIFHNASSEPVTSFNQFFGEMDAELAYSYDGIRFFRGIREPFLKLNPIPEHGCAQIRPCSIIDTGREILIYSEGHRAGHGRENREQRLTEEPLGSLLVHRLRRDGWMYLRSRGDWARIQTKPFTLFGPSICANVKAKFGEVLFQISDEKSQPIDGFTFEDCAPIQAADGLDLPLRWKGRSDLSGLENRVLRLEVKFRNAQIYAFSMAHHFLDAHDMRLLQDGKPIETRLFDY